MRVVIQRVSRASVSVGGEEKGRIGRGMAILVGVCDQDGDEDIEYLCQKIVKLRIFPDADGVLNLPLTAVDGANVLVVSQFTLMASTRKGNRPSYIRASRPEVAVPLYERFVSRLAELLGHNIPTGVFGADMQLELVNDGPVTIIIDSHERDF